MYVCVVLCVAGPKSNALFFVDPTRAEDFLRFRSSKRAAAATGGVGGGRRKSRKGSGVAVLGQGDSHPPLADEGNALRSALSDEGALPTLEDNQGSNLGALDTAGEESSHRPSQSNLTLLVPERISPMESKRVTYALDYFGGVATNLTLGSEESDLTFSPANRKRSLSDSNIESKLTYHSFFSKSASREFDWDKQDILKTRVFLKGEVQEAPPRSRATSIAADSSSSSSSRRTAGIGQGDAASSSSPGRQSNLTRIESPGQVHGAGDEYGDGDGDDVGLDLLTPTDRTDTLLPPHPPSSSSQGAQGRIGQRTHMSLLYVRCLMFV